MKQLLYILCLVLPVISHAQNFEDYFEDKTLRVDYIFGGNLKEQIVLLDVLNELPKWAGKRHNLSTSYLDGNGQIKMYDLQSDSCIYKNTFSTLFQEWLTTDEAKKVSRSFENVYLLPFPKDKVRIEVSFREKDGSYKKMINHIVDPSDILILKKGSKTTTSYTVVGNENKAESRVNVAILAEGFTRSEMDKFNEYAKETVNQILSYKPFDKYKDNFNFYIVESESEESGVSVPRQNEWKNTAISSNFDTFYSDRYLTSTHLKDIHNLLAGIPYEHIIILANTDVYGGGGIYNAYTLTTTGHASFKPVVVHEFGHSFAGLADEYFYEGDTFDDTYPKSIEPWEKNVTTLVDFSSKWKDMLPPHTPIPTALNDSLKYKVGVYKGAAYSTEGIYRGSTDCRMKTNTCKEFCPICQKSIERLILSYLQEDVQ